MESQRHLFDIPAEVSYYGNLVAELREKNIYISQRGLSLRFAPHLHVNDNDIDRLMQAI